MSRCPISPKRLCRPMGLGSLIEQFPCHPSLIWCIGQMCKSNGCALDPLEDFCRCYIKSRSEAQECFNVW